MKADLLPITILNQPLHDGRISPRLYGGFMELLEDVVPGMWAEMLGDRSFEGTGQASDWCYYNGQPNMCDRHWETHPSWCLTQDKVFNRANAALLTAKPGQPACLTQAGLAVKRSMDYHFSAYLRASGELKVTVSLKTLLPDGKWMTLARTSFSPGSRRWQKSACHLKSVGTTDHAMLEVKASGNGKLWADKLSLMPADNVNGWRRDVITAIRELRPPIIRWGGSVIDPGQYKWKDSIGDRDLRVPFKNKVWGRIDPNDVGIDEFLQFCEAVEAEPLVCVSFADGPQSAVELIKYCNGDQATSRGKIRAKNGHPEPYNVKYWQIGNELGDSDYVKGLLPFCKAIRKAQPQAIIISSYPSKELLEKVGDYIDIIAPHYYTPDLNKVMESIMHWKNTCAELRSERNIKIGVTEWNSSGGDWGRDRAVFSTLGAELFAAKYLNLMQRHSDMVALACYSNLANSYCGGLIQTNAAGLYRIPSYYVLKLYSEYSRPIPLTITDLPEGLDISACGSEDSRALTLFVVNERKTVARLALKLEGFTLSLKLTGGKIVCDSRGRAQSDIVNHWAEPERVKITDLRCTSRGVIVPALSVAAIAYKVI